MHVCFIVPHAYSLFDSTSPCVFGGSEVRAWTFGSALALHPDYTVSFIVFAPGESRTIRQGDLHVRTYTPERAGTDRRSSQGLIARVARYLKRESEYEGKSSLRAVMEQVHADTYCVFGASDYSGAVAEVCREFGRPLVLFTGSDGDFAPSNRKGAMRRNLYGSTGHGAWLAMTGARLVITQTGSQAQLLKTQYGKIGVTIRNPIALARSAAGREAPSSRDYALWIGKADEVKRPEIVMELARQVPDLRFVMVVNRVDPSAWTRLIENRPSNVEIHEHLPFVQAEALFERAWVFINTSTMEGFPNTFLQAGKYGVPILSLTVDPDEFIVRTGSGLVCQGDHAEFSRSLKRFHEDGMFWKTCSAAVTRYVAEKHEVNARVRELDAAFKQLMPC